MKLYPAKIDGIAGELVSALVENGDIEITNRSEAELDVAAVLKEYVRLDRELTERAKDIIEIRKLPQSALFRTKRALADQKDFGLGEEGVSWMCTQLLETFMQSKHVDEIYSDDASMRRKMKAVFHRHMSVDNELDEEVRSRIKNLEEGTASWDVEYKRVMEQIKRGRGLDD